MPAISAQNHGRLLRARDWQQTVGQSGMTPTAFSFLIPVFVVAVVAPFIIVYCVRKRRRVVTPVATRVTPKVKKPALRRAEAREKLKEITQISSPVSNATQEDQETPQGESRSVLERECAICLSTLYAPSPPEPAKLSPTSSLSDDSDDVPAAIPSSLTPATAQAQPADTVTTTAAAVATQPESETILKLTVCGHEFHAECLVSWFVLRKTSCPICRSMYMSAEEMEKYDEEEQIALGGTPTVTPTTSADPEAQVASSSSPQQQSVEVRNWRYFLHGHDAFRRMQERLARRQTVTQAQTQAGVELQDQSAAARGQSELQSASEAAPGAANQEQSPTSRWRRFFSRS